MTESCYSFPVSYDVFLAFNFTVDLVDLFGPFDSGVDFIWPYFTFIFYVERPISKFDLRSGQVKVRSTSGHDRSRSIRISSEAAWRAKSFGTICTSLSPSCRDLLAKTGLRPHLTSGDLPVTPNHQLRTDHHRWGECPWFWKNWVVSVGLCETGSIFIFPHRFIMGRSRNSPDLRSPG